MNEANPFQVPAWSRINREQRRRERFKRLVITAIVTFALMLVGSLILHNKTELAARETRDVADSQPGPVPNDSTAASIPTATAPTVQARPATLYVVKAGDTLSGIAKAHGTNAKALEAANDLANDRIFIGEKLKIPGN